MTITDFFANTAAIKAFVRGIDVSTDISAFAPVYRQAAKKFINLVGQATYDMLAAHIKTPPDETDADKDLAVEYSRGALANILAIPWFNMDAGNRNASDNSKLYRYQEDKIIETYLENAWAELDQLVLLMEEKDDVFTDFAASDIYLQRDGLYIKNAAEFDKYYGIDGSSYFYYKAIYIQREVENELIKSRIKDTPDDEDLLYQVKKAIAFETVARACQRFDYSELPKGIRNEIIKEIGGSVNRNEMGSIKNDLYSLLHSKAMNYIATIDISIKSAASTTAPVVPEEVNLETNKFYLMR